MYDLVKLVREYRQLSLNIRKHQRHYEGGEVSITPAYARDRLRRNDLREVFRHTGRKSLDQLLGEEDVLQGCINDYPGDENSPTWRRDRTRIRREISNETDPGILSTGQVIEAAWRITMALGEQYRGLPGLPLLRISGTPLTQTIFWDQGPDRWPSTAAMHTGSAHTYESFWLRVDAGMHVTKAATHLTGLELPSGVTVEVQTTCLLLKPEGIRS
jgi:hypothetical protein